MVNCIRILDTFTVRILVLQAFIVVMPSMKFGCTVLSKTTSHSQPNRPQITLAYFGRSYRGTVNSSTGVVLEYTYLEFGNTTTAVRMTVKILSDVNAYAPVHFVARQKQGILSWQMPFILHKRYTYYTVSRTLCPLDAVDEKPITSQQTIYLDVSTMEKRNVNFIVAAVRVPSFQLKTNEELSLNITPSEPQYYMYTFPDNVDSVVVKATSNDDLCMSLSVHCFKCPVFDLDKSKKFLDAEHTMTKQAVITARKSKYPNHSFLVVMAMDPKDTKCHGVKNVFPSGIRTKTVSIKIVPAVTATMYFVAISSTIIAFLAFSTAAYFIYDTYCEKILRPSFFKKEAYQQKQLCEDVIKGKPKEKGVPYVINLAKEDQEKNRDKKFTAYCSILGTISIFYGLPVLQLVITDQKMLHKSGNHDVCYYNFECARPLGVFSSFNNLFSNIGYVILGTLFIILIGRRTKLCNDVVEYLKLKKTYGIPQHNGLFYSMGLALCIEGVMSACYHVCPNYSNFQYDTSFMYIMACLYILRIYQNRHQDVTPEAHTSFVVMAMVIFIAVLGMVIEPNTFWVIFWLLDTLYVLHVSIWMYYVGYEDIQFDRQMFKKIYRFVIQEGGFCSKPMDWRRLLVVATVAILNFLYATFGLIYQPRDFASFLLGKFIGNILLYTQYYIFMKKIYHETIQKLTSVCILAALILWDFALCFFFKSSTSWELTPSRSRERNQPCVLLDFYDRHDVWHFLSAISMFFSFMILLTVDDDLITTSRDQIVVF